MALNNLSQWLSRDYVERKPMDEKDDTIEANDVEGQGQRPRRMSRIDGKLPASDAASGESIEALIAKEKDNAIKYRTCSWQKVSLNPHE